MGKGSSIKSLSVCESQLSDLRADMQHYYTFIENYRKALMNMIAGDGKGASGSSYWNGENAYEWFEKAIKEHTKLYSNYLNNYAAFKSFAKTYVKAWNKAKKSKKSVDTYLNGVGQNVETLSYDVLTAVSKDASSDTQDDIKGASAAFTSLNTALTDMISVLSGMMDGWNNVRLNTKGDLQEKAIKRYNYTNNHRKRLISAQEEFTTNYTMDTIFSDDLGGMDAE